MAICYPWRDVISTIHDDMLSMARSCPWRYVINGEMLSMARWYLWRDVIHGAMLSMARCYPWSEMLLSLFMTRWYPTYQNHLSHHPRLCYHVLHLLMYSGTSVLSTMMFTWPSTVSWVRFSHSLSDNSPSENTFKIVHLYIILVIWHFGR